MEEEKDWFKEGYEWALKGEYHKAIECYDKAIELKPDDAGAYNNKGIALYGLGNYQQAIECYDKAIALKPDDASAYYNKGNALYGLGNYQQAIEWFDKVIALKPDDAGAYNNKGNALYGLGNYQQAIECYDKVIALKPDDAGAYNNKGNALYGLGNYQQAIECYDKALDNNPGLTIASQGKELTLRLTAEREKPGAPAKDVETYMLLYDKRFFEETIEGSREEDREYYDNIYIQSLKILVHLQIKDDEREKYVAHYTSSKTANILFFDQRKEEDKNNNDNELLPRMRLFSVTNSNDRQEGKTLFDYLFDGRKISQQAEKYVAFVACFMFNHDNLNQFRLYGKKDGTKEGTGVSIVMNSNFFCQTSRPPLPMSDKRLVIKEDEKSPLYRCIYIDPDTNQIVSVGHRDDHTFYKTKEIIFNYPEREDCIAAMSDEITNYKKVIEEKRNKVIGLMEELKKMIAEKWNVLDRRIICDLLLNLRYLVKHVAFKEEQECRIIEIKGPSDSDKKNKPRCEEDKRFFVDYRSLKNCVHKVYFGPRAQGMELFQNRLSFEPGFEKVVCARSTSPLA